jgi:very-short-patch-repair endonuclease
MLLVEKNLQEFGYETPAGNTCKYRQLPVFVKYDCCGIERKIIWRTYLASGATRCVKCSANSSEGKAQRSKQAKEAWQDPEYRDNEITRITKMFQSEEHRKLVSERNAEWWKDPEYKSKMSAAPWTEEAKLTRHIAQNTPEYLENQRAKALERFKDEDYKARIAAGLARFAESGNRSAPEQQMASILTGLGLKHKAHSIGPYTFDFFIEEHNLLIEIQGDYWHTLPHHANRDIKKASYIQNNFPNLKLLAIWEHMFSFEDKVIELIKYHTGITKIEIVQYDLSALVIKEINHKDADVFLDNWHYASHGRTGGHCFGAFLGEKLVTVLKFLPLGRQNVIQSIENATNPIELARMATHPKYQIKNLVSYCLSRMIKMLPVEFDVIVSYSDKTYNHYGSSYKATNFINDKIVSADYKYVDAAGWVCSKKALYNKARAAHLKEAEFAERFNYVKVYGYEKLRWIYRR